MVLFDVALAKRLEEYEERVRAVVREELRQGSWAIVPAVEDEAWVAAVRRDLEDNPAAQSSSQQP